ncbi:hypothetical protein MFIFM68171_00655 [Madurella fahalii]|uniref:Uncharacterized protein n=1 Tax=Madurella fahalii TaxID=1157608 RepID=A0ABQ0FY57_9PEZI
MTAPASHCCRALQRQIIPSRDAVWITDSLLASAFERYCLVSRAWNRKASNVPGPLESQRRLGRRRMGDFNAWYCPPTPPPWGFAVPLNLSQWTWEPPSLACAVEQGRLRPDKPSAGKLMPGPPGWLQELLPLDTEERPAALAALLSDVGSSAAAATRDRPSFAASMDDFRWAAAHATDGTFASCTKDICRELERLIFLGEMAPEDIVPFSSEIWAALESRFQGSPLGHQLCLSLSRAILTGAATSRVFELSFLDIQFWSAAFAQLAKLPAGDELCDLFVEIMTAMPAVHRGQVSGGILSVLDVFFSAWSCSEHAPNATDITRLLDVNLLGSRAQPLPGNLRHARAISQALQTIAPEEPDGLLNAANRLVLNQAAVSATGLRALRYNWLCVLASMPRVNQDVWFDLAAALSGSSLEKVPMTGVELCSLLLTQWKSRGYVKSPNRFYRTYKRYRAEHDEAAIASLFMTIFRHERSETHTGLYRSSWKLLAKLGQTDDAFSSLEFDAANFELPLPMLQNLAWTSDNHRVAIRLRDWYTGQLRRPHGPEWNPCVFEKYAKSIVLDPSLPTKEIWRVLDINSFENPKKSSWEKTRRHRGTYGERRVRIVEEVSTAFANATDLPDRVAFRHVYQAFRYIEAVEGRVPLAVIKNLYHVATRDLRRQQPGRTKRLLWLLTVIQRTYGVELAWNCRLVLRRWRFRLKRLWLGMDCK